MKTTSKTTHFQLIAHPDDVCTCHFFFFFFIRLLANRQDRWMWTSTSLTDNQQAGNVTVKPSLITCNASKQRCVRRTYVFTLIYSRTGFIHQLFRISVGLLVTVQGHPLFKKQGNIMSCTHIPVGNQLSSMTVRGTSGRARDVCPRWVTTELVDISHQNDTFIKYAPYLRQPGTHNYFVTQDVTVIFQCLSVIIFCSSALHGSSIITVWWTVAQQSWRM